MEGLWTFAILATVAAGAAGAAWVAVRTRFRQTGFSLACDGHEMAMCGHHTDALRLYNRAIAEFRRTERTLPGYMKTGGYTRMGLAHAWRAVTLARLGRAGEALDDSERAGELGSADRRVWLARASVLQITGMNGDLLEMADARIAADASDVNMHLYRAAALLGLDEPEPAAASLAKAHELAPDSGLLRRTLSVVERTGGLRGEDRALYDRHRREAAATIARLAAVDADWGHA